MTKKKIKHNKRICPKCGSKKVFAMGGEGRNRNLIFCKCAELSCDTYWGFKVCDEEPV